jgi:hypothetical protein
MSDLLRKETKNGTYCMKNLSLTDDKPLSNFTVTEPNNNCIWLNCTGKYHQKLDGLVCSECRDFIPLPEYQKVRL